MAGFGYEGTSNADLSNRRNAEFQAKAEATAQLSPRGGIIGASTLNQARGNGRLDELGERIRDANQAARDLAVRAEIIADKHFGPEPQSEGATTCVDPAYGGLLGALHGGVGDLRSPFNRLAAALDRLETL